MGRVSLMECGANDAPQSTFFGANWEAQVGRLVSLWDMLRVYAEKYLILGRNIEEAITVFRFADADREHGESGDLDEEEKSDLKKCLEKIKAVCEETELPIARGLIEGALNNLPQNARELERIIHAVYLEIGSRLFLFVPSHRARYHESEKGLALTSEMKTDFPSASKELIHGGTCYAVGEYTACVFHAMRAAEIGLRAVAKYLNVSLSIPLELAEWHTLIGLIDKHLKNLMQQPRAQIRDEEIDFLSNANSQFINFKEAFRKHVAHARDSYEEVQSISILHRTKEFLEVLSSKVAE